MSPDLNFESGPGIGTRLKEARRRLGMDVKEAEERTKIRARYLRALEAEEWEVLPGAAYVRGFLRSYGQVLGLDGELLADEFRRRHEDAANGHIPEPPPPRRRRNGGGASRGLLALIALVVLIVVLIVIGAIGGSGDGSSSEPGAHARSGEVAGKQRAGKKRKAARRSARKPGLSPVELHVEALDAVRVCLVGGRRDALIDSQLMGAGTRESFAGERRYRIDLEGGGAVKVAIDGERRDLDAPADASYELDEHGVHPVAYAGAGCP